MEIGMAQLMLRFRDLNIDDGKTIAEHQIFIDRNKYVWWGWWNKGGEQIFDTRPFLSEISKNKKIDAYLLDTGQAKLYKCEIVDIKFYHDKHVSPDKRCPKYYANKRLLVWFKIVKIDEVHGNINDALQNLSYCDSNYDLFEKDLDIYEKLYNKKIKSANELKSQERSIWFVRDAIDTDSDADIEFINVRDMNAEPFSRSYIPLSGEKIHWISDIHFSDNPAHHNFGRVFTNLELEKMMLDKFSDSLESLIVSGDMTWRASVTEFEKTYDFYKKLVSGSQAYFNFDKLGMCPGNHDLLFEVDISKDIWDAYNKVQLTKLGHKNDITDSDIHALQSVATTPSQDKAYREHFRKIVKASANEYLSMGKKFLANGQRAIDICFLNSSRLSQIKSLFQGHGVITAEQLSDAKEKMNWKKHKSFGSLRIVVLHHNVLPVEYSRVPSLDWAYSSCLHDAQALIQWCAECEVDVILHGHTHQKSIQKYTHFDESVKNLQGREIWIVGLGSSGVAGSHKVDGENNAMAVLDFSKEHIEIQFYNIAKNSINESGNRLVLR